ncbi:MAG: hypothetical protein HY926_03870 [Elusimicrobia bacterium]|nr:hypothetical protein [Elusimicrobiota bacterium]
MNIAKRPKHVHRYKNLSGDSKVVRYEIAKDAVIIYFKDCTVYRYTNQTADPVNVKKMKDLAVSGKGLGTFIEKHLKDRWSHKIR